MDVHPVTADQQTHKNILDICQIHTLLTSYEGPCPIMCSVERVEIAQQNGSYCPLLIFFETKIARDLLHASS